MSKNIELDKFYTPIETSKFCVELMLKTFKFEISEFIEPSAGSGNFSKLVPNCIAYDIQPEDDSIIKADFLSLKIPYIKGRVIFGNPPFGDRNNLSVKFYKKSVQIADGIAFILPISQLNNSDSLFDFDLIESVDLGVLSYSGMKIHCCFNIYQRPINGLNKKPNLKTDLFDIYREDYNGYENIQYDFCIFRRGASSGKEKTKDIHTQTYKIVVTDKSKVQFVKDKILNFDFKNFKKHQSAPSISKNDIYRLFK